MAYSAPFFHGDPMHKLTLFDVARYTCRTPSKSRTCQSTGLNASRVPLPYYFKKMNPSPTFLVAAGISVLSACSDSAPPPTPFVIADSADQIMFGVTATITHDGVMQAMIEADTAFQYELRQVTEFKGLTVYFYNSMGARTSTLTSREGTFHWISEDMEARGNVVAVTPDDRRLTTEVLVYQKLRNQISGSMPFEYDAPDQHLEGDAFTSDTDFRNVEATRPSGTLGSVDLDR